jgi:thiamine-monophosphate kinase
MNSSRTLQDVGEFWLIDRIIMPLAQRCDKQTETGNDCALIPVSECLLAITADVGPKPLLNRLKGFENDLEAWGWLSVVASASDIATSGARPFFLTNCIDAPTDLPIDKLERFLLGYFDACSEFGFKNGGGDLRQGPELAMRVFATGICSKSHMIGRNATIGNILYVIGPTGRLMSHFLIADSILENNEKIPQELENVLRFPRPQLKAMKILADQGLVVAASDTSDGLLGAIENISRKSVATFT